MFRLFTCIALILISTALNLSAQLPLIPWPQEVSMLDSAPIARGTGIQLDFMTGTTASHDIITRQLTQELTQAGFRIPNRNATLRIRLGIPSESAGFRQHLTASGIEHDSRIGDEGYILKADSRGITISANTPAGLFYGAQTLRQLLRHAAHTGSLPAVHIVDWPHMRERGIMDDISRGPVPTLEFFKEQIDRFSEMKINRWMHYVENVVQISSRPDFAAPGGSLSLDEYRELIAYAKERHIALIGSFQSFGHFYQIGNLPQYNHLLEGNALLTPALEASYEFLNDVYNDLIPVFEYPVFHVNADETFDLGVGRSAPLVDSLGKGRVYADHLDRLYEMVNNKHGKVMGIWGDIVLQEEAVFDMLPEDVIITTWNYDGRESFDDIIEPITSKGFETWVAPGVLHSFRTFPDFDVAMKNIHRFIRDGRKYDVSTVLTTTWDDGGGGLFSRKWFGIAYASDQSWNNSEFDHFWDFRFSTAFHGDYSGNVAEAIHVLGTLADIVATDRMNERVLWTRLVPERLETIRFGIRDWEEVLITTARVDSLLNSASPTLRKVDLDYLRHTSQTYTYMANVRYNLLKAAELYREASFLQIPNREEARVKLLEAKRRVEESLASLVVLRGDYERVWLMENRMYALDRVTERFDRQIHDLTDLSRRLQIQLQNFESGHYLMAPNQVRLSIVESEDRYFREWMVSGPIMLRPGEQFEADYLLPMGGQAAARPRITQEFDIDGRGIRWHRLATNDYAVVDLTSYNPDFRRAVIYAHAMIDTDRAFVTKASVGSSDGIEVWVNGERVHSNLTTRNLTPDEDRFEIRLEEGRNHILLKISNTGSDWGFTFQLPDDVIRNSRNRYRIDHPSE